MKYREPGLAGTRGEFALHVQCPWRIEGPEGVVTGRSDLWEPAEENPDWDPWEDYDEGPESAGWIGIAELLGTNATGERSGVNDSDRLIVERLERRQPRWRGPRAIPAGPGS